MSRQRILEGAWILLEQAPLNELTVDAIARSLHMSKSTLYKYFTSKDEVLVGLVESACAATREDVRRLGPELGARELDDAVLAALYLFARHAERLPAAILLEEHALPPAAHALLDAVWRELHDLCRSAIAQAGRSDEIVAKAMSTSARAAMATAAAGEVEAKRGDAVRSLRALFLCGLAPAA